MGWKKTVGIVVAGIMTVGVCTTQREMSRRSSLTPAQRAAEDSAAADRASAEQATKERTPAYQKGLAHFAIKQRAKDPDAVQFRNEWVTQKADSIAVCGEVNLKNGFGGYVGFKPYVMIRGAVIMESDIKDIGASVAEKFFAMCKWAELNAE